MQQDDFNCKIDCHHRQVTLFEEFVLLKEYEKREDVMEAKVSGKQQEKLDMQAKVRKIEKWSYHNGGWISTETEIKLLYHYQYV